MLVWTPNLILAALDCDLRAPQGFRFASCRLLIAVTRATGNDEHKPLNGVFAPLLATAVGTIIRRGEHSRGRQFFWANQCEELTAGSARGGGLELFYMGVLDRASYLHSTRGIWRFLRGANRSLAFQAPASPWQEGGCGALLRFCAGHPPHAMRLPLPPDGYTIGFVAPNNAINATLYEKLPFDFVRDSVPVAATMLLTNVMVVHPSFPAKTVAKFITYAKANPGKINMASGGSGTSVHMSGALFKVMTGINMQHVPYRGTAIGGGLPVDYQLVFGGLLTGQIARFDVGSGGAIELDAKPTPVLQ